MTWGYLVSSVGRSGTSTSTETTAQPPSPRVTDEAFETLHELGVRLTAADSLDAMLHELLDAGSALLGARRGMVVLAEGPVVGTGLDHAALGALETVPAEGGPYGGGEVLHADLTGLGPVPGPGGEEAAGAGTGPGTEDRYREVAAQLGIGASYALPLAVRPDAAPLGAAVWFFDEPTRPAACRRQMAGLYCADAARQLDRELDRERLRRTAEALRRGLLPDRLPQVPRLRLAARCLPAALAEAGGSDWYDAVALPDGTVGLTVGSVAGGSGDGPGAAAAMGRLRAALRAYAVLEGEDPVSVLGDLELLLKTTEPNRTATALYASVDPSTRRLSLAGAGQCPPLLVTAYGASFVETSLSAPLGMLSCWEAPGVELRADRGDLLVLYTEGLARRSGGSLYAGQARLRAAAADAPYEVRQDPERFCGHLLATCVDPDAPAEDDLVVLTARFT
jgi:hypothetical protein